jgi:hypothetical protein
VGYLDGLSAGFFKRDSAGRELFFPRGRWGRGRIVPSEEDGAALRRYLKVYNVGLIVGVILIGLVGGSSLGAGWAIGIGLVSGVMSAVAWMPMQRRIRTWQHTDERLSYRQSLGAEAKAHSPTSLWGMIGLFFLLATLFVAGVLYADSAVERIVFALAAVLCGVGGIVYLFMLRVRKRA